MTQTASEICKRYRENNKEEFYLAQKKRRATLRGRLVVLFQSARTRSKAKEVPFNITIEDLHKLYQEQRGLCAISKIEMQLDTGEGKGHANTFAISLDRKIPELGYTKENIQLICLAVNRFKWNFTDQEFKFWLRTISREVLRNEETFND